MHKPYAGRIVIEHARIVGAAVLERGAHAKQNFGRNFCLTFRLPKSRDTTHLWNLLLL
jgi:hypothetical protein